ncbi:MAG: MMPL family transporter [Parvularculaceae bacterium]
MLRVFEFILVRWTGAARRSGWFGLIAILAATAAAGYYAAANLKVNTDTSSMLDPDLPFQQRAAELREAFPDAKTDVSVVVSAPTLDEVEAFSARLRARLIERDDMFSAVFAASAEPFFLDNGLLYLDERELESRLTQLSRAAGLIERLAASPRADVLFDALRENDELAERADLGDDALDAIYAELADVIDAAAAGGTQPFSWLGALQPDAPPSAGRLRIVNARPALDYGRLQPAKPAIDALRAEIDAIAVDFDGRLTTHVTGDPALRADELSAVTRGLSLSLSLSFVLVAALLMVAFRSVRVTVATLASLVVSIVLTGAFAAAAIGELNLVSVAFTVLLVGLGLDFAIHLLLHVQERRVAGQKRDRALSGAVGEVGAALALAAPTTAVGFFAFVPTRFDGIAQLGVIAGGGVLISFMVAVTFIPAALGALNSPARGGDPLANRPPSRRGPLGRLALPVAVLTDNAGLGSLALLPNARFDADPMALRDPTSDSVVGFNLLFDDPDAAPYRLTRIVDDEEAARETAATGAALQTVRTTRTLFDFVPDEQDAKLELIDFASGSLVFALSSADAQGATAPPENAALATSAAALSARLASAHAGGSPAGRLSRALTDARERPGALARADAAIFAYWPQLIDRLSRQLNADYVETDALPEALTRRYRTDDGRLRVDFLPAEDVRDPAALRRFTDEAAAAFPDVAGGAIQTRKAGEEISAAMLQATLVALGLISAFLWLTLRKLSEVVLMLFPLALAAALTTGAGVLFDVPFNYANVIVLPLLLGIGVDSGIHLVMRARHVDAGAALFGTATPRAVLFSALTTVASFASLVLSPHRGTASMGQLLSIAIAFTLICTLVVLPVMLDARAAMRRRRAAKPA